MRSPDAPTVTEPGLPVTGLGGAMLEEADAPVEGPFDVLAAEDAAPGSEREPVSGPEAPEHPDRVSAMAAEMTATRFPREIMAAS